MLFDGPRDVAQDLAGLSTGDFDFAGFVLDKVELHECNYNWKTFIEVYLEDYHVGPFHPGLGQFVTCEDLTWQFADWTSVQTVGINNRLAKPGVEDVCSGTRRCSSTTAARRRRTARSGSPTTRTSWSSGTRTCWW